VDRTTRRDTQKSDAIPLFRRAAKQGHANGATESRHLLREAQGVPKDLARVVRCFRQAAEKGMDEGQFSLGKCYQDGRGVNKDLANAECLQRKEAQQGHRRAGPKTPLGQREVR
jgi:TPR repeat protein